MRRKTVWTPKPVSTTRRAGPTEKELEGWHRHGCCLCSATYEDSCANPLGNGQCTTCRGQKAPIWELNLRPRECCESSEPVTPQEMSTYRLGGDTEWWLCPKCKRPHVFKPRHTEGTTHAQRS